MLFLLFFATLSFANPAVVPPANVKAVLSIPDWVESHGYPCEEHIVVTPDEYILKVHRIPPHQHSLGAGKQQVVFLMHGLLSSSADWLMSGPGKALAYLLADEGYDVWMGNARGNTQSRNHTRLDPNSAAFWDFSWHEIGYTDLPTMIDHVLEQTGKSQLFYAGHSQGTTSFFVMTSMKPDYNEKIIAQFSLAPIAFMNHMTSPLFQFIALFNGPLSVLLDMIGVNEFLPNNKFLSLVSKILCGDDSLTQMLCTNSLFAICGFSPREMNATILPELTEYTPAGSSTKQFLHYAQEINSGHFRQYDYGIFANKKKYGSMKPPDYNLKKITAPVYLFYSHNDWLSAETDVLRLYRKLPNCQGRFLVTDGSFNHLDYMYAIHAPSLVYSRMISLMTRYN